MATDGKFFELLAGQSAAGKTIKGGASAIGCSERQAYRISAMPEFRHRVAELRTEALNAATGEITAATVQAVRKLVALLDEPNSALGAAKAILVHVAPLTELGELRQRIDSLERGQMPALRVVR